MWAAKVRYSRIYLNKQHNLCHINVWWNKNTQPRAAWWIPLGHIRPSSIHSGPGTIENLISAGTAYISPKLEAESGAHTTSYSVGTVTPCLRLQQPGHVNHSFPLLPRPRLSRAQSLLSTCTFFGCAGTYLRLSRFLICVNGERNV